MYVGVIEYGIEKYFSNENAPNLQSGNKIKVVILVGDGLTARIKRLLVNGVELNK